MIMLAVAIAASICPTAFAFTSPLISTVTKVSTITTTYTTRTTDALNNRCCKPSWSWSAAHMILPNHEEFNNDRSSGSESKNKSYYDDALEQKIKQKLHRITQGYKTHINQMIQTCDMEIELANKTEQCLLSLNDDNNMKNDVNDNNDLPLLLSEKYTMKRGMMKDCFNVNYEIVSRLLLQEGVDEEASRADDCSLLQKIQFATIHSFKGETRDDLSKFLGNGGVTNDQERESEGYDTAQQVIHHTARDWTLGSSTCRDLTNGWIVNAIIESCSSLGGNTNTGKMKKLRVLVPGAGLGRLAFDIATCEALLEGGGGGKMEGVHVEANDSSVTMTFATQSVLEMLQQQTQQSQQQPVRQYTIYPFISDPQRNEVDSFKRFESELFPDEIAFESYQRYVNLINKTESNYNNDDDDDDDDEMKMTSFTATTTLLPTLSYTVGDFVYTYSQNDKRGMYDVIATSFFIDTATNIYEYIMIMKHLLQSTTSYDDVSLWINCGPVQWHPCALLRPTVDELKDILEMCGFELLTWEIANEIVAYRHPDDCGVGVGGSQARYTRSEAYRPLRFVARLRPVGDDQDPTNVNEDLPMRIEYCEYLNGVANGGAVVR